LINSFDANVGRKNQLSTRFIHFNKTLTLFSELPF